MPLHDDHKYDFENEDDDNLCPLCMEELDITDKRFKPCTCGYQMCRFCWHHIKENLNARCPHCRKPYAPENYTFVPPDPSELEKQKREKKIKEREKRTGQDSTSKRSLKDIRVVQRNLVYVTNLALSSAKEEILKRQEFFGQYGKVLKIVINKSNLYNVESPDGPSVSAYITFQKKEDAIKAILAVNQAWLDGRQLRASFGTTKYCSFFLRNLQCTNPDCMYLHELGGEKDSFTKEEMAQGKHLLLPEAIPAPNQNPTGKGLPPPPIILKGTLRQLGASGSIPVPPPNSTSPAPGQQANTSSVPPTTTTVPTTSPTAASTTNMIAPTPLSGSTSTLVSSSNGPSLTSSSSSLLRSSKDVPKPAWNIPTTTATPPVTKDLEQWPSPAAASTTPPPMSTLPQSISKLGTSQDKVSALPASASWASKSSMTVSPKSSGVWGSAQRSSESLSTSPDRLQSNSPEWGSSGNPGVYPQGSKKDAHQTYDEGEYADEDDEEEEYSSSQQHKRSTSYNTNEFDEQLNEQFQEQFSIHARSEESKPISRTSSNIGSSEASSSQSSAMLSSNNVWSAPWTSTQRSQNGLDSYDWDEPNAFNFVDILLSDKSGAHQLLSNNDSMERRRRLEQFSSGSNGPLSLGGSNFGWKYSQNDSPADEPVPPQSRPSQSRFQFAQEAHEDPNHMYHNQQQFYGSRPSGFNESPFSFMQQQQSQTGASQGYGMQGQQIQQGMYAQASFAAQSSSGHQVEDWLRSLLPHANISFGNNTPPQTSNPWQQQEIKQPVPQPQPQPQPQSRWGAPAPPPGFSAPPGFNTSPQSNAWGTSSSYQSTTWNQGFQSNYSEHDLRQQYSNQVDTSKLLDLLSPRDSNNSSANSSRNNAQFEQGAIWGQQPRTTSPPGIPVSSGSTSPVGFNSASNQMQQNRAGFVDPAILGAGTVYDLRSFEEQQYRSPWTSANSSYRPFAQQQQPQSQPTPPPGFAFVQGSSLGSSKDNITKTTNGGITMTGAPKKVLQPPPGLSPLPDDGKKVRRSRSKNASLTDEDFETAGLVNNLLSNDISVITNGPNAQINVNFNVSTTNTFTVLQNELNSGDAPGSETSSNADDKEDDPTKKEKLTKKKKKAEKKKKEAEMRLKEEQDKKKLQQKGANGTASLASPMIAPRSNEIEKLEKEVENAKREVKGLEDKLLELRLRNQEIDF